MANSLIIIIEIIITITKQVIKGKINDRVFGFLHISLVTCNKNKMGISRFRHNVSVKFWYGTVERSNAFFMLTENKQKVKKKKKSHVLILEHKLTQ